MSVEHSNNNTRVQKIKCTYNVILRSVRANIGGFRNFSESPQKWRYCIDVGKKLGGYAAILVVHEKISLTINMALSERVTEFSAFVRTQ